MASLHLTQLYRLQGLAENSCSEMHSMGFISVAGKAGLSCAFLLGARAAQTGEGSGQKSSSHRPAPSGAHCEGNRPKTPPLPGWEAVCGGDTLPGSGLRAETPSATEGQMSHARSHHTVPRAREVATSSPTLG